MVVTPLAQHGGSVPPLVVPSGRALTLSIDAGWSGARVETDGQAAAGQLAEGEMPAFRLDIAFEREAATLLDFDGETMIAGLRRRGVIADSPRLRARDARGKR
jgi:NAD+ kinase